MKKLFQRIIIVSVLCIATLMFGLNCVIPVDAEETQSSTPVISVAAVESSGGEEVNVPIQISDNTGILGARICVAYDSRLELTAAAKGEAFAGLTFTRPGDLTANPVYLVWDGVEADLTSGEIAVLTFKVPADLGTYNISISYEKGDIINGDFGSVAVAMEDGKITVESSVPHTHELTKVEAKAATCLEEGYEAYWTCSVCGALFSDEDGTVEISEPVKTPKADHTAKAVPAVDPTCTETGLTEGSICAVCGEVLKEQETIPATGHSWDEGAVVTAPTCVAKGEKTFKCLNCDMEKTESLPIDPDNHTGETVIKDQVAAGCEEEGYSGDIYCADCDVLIGRGETVAAIGHNWGEWKVVVEPTEQSEGLKERACLNDPSHVENYTIERLPHQHVLEKCDAVAASCDTDGNIEYFICNGCGRVFKDAEGLELINEEDTVLPATGHSWGEWTVITEPSETEEGLEERVCANDALHKESRPIPILTHIHELVKVEAVPATCETAGNIEYYECSTCGRIFMDEASELAMNEEDMVIPAIGHVWGEWTVVEEATAAKDGSEQRVCANDPDHVEMRSIPYILHTHSLVKTESKEATCTESGNIEYWICKGCGKNFSDEIGSTELKEDDIFIPAIGHDWGEWTVTKEATYEEDGEETRVCKHNSEHTEKRAVPKLIGKVTGISLGTEKLDMGLTTSQALAVEFTPSNVPAQDLTWTSSDENIVSVDENGVITAGKIGSAVITATLTDDSSIAASCTVNVWFKDVMPGDVKESISKYIYWASGRGIVNGYPDGNYGRLDNCTRNQFATMIWKLAGSPKSKKKANAYFADMTGGTAVAWAYENGIIGGTKKGSQLYFNPSDNVTRSQLVTMLWKMAEKPNVKKGKKTFSDVKYPNSSITWASSLGIVGGYSDGTFAPKANVTRQQIATMLYKFNAKVLE